jgi:glycosyltransferase involved in cell wall biosynthesis
MKLSILIPTTPDREHFLTRLKGQFYEQIGHVHPIPFDRSVFPEGLYGYTNDTVELIYFEDDREHSLGYKRNILLSISNADYVAFIDDDDRIGENYFKRLLEGIEHDVDCCSLRGVITENGINPLIFEHTIKYKAYKTNPDTEPIRYERYPNHLNCIRSSIAKQFTFPDKNHGEDTDWATKIFNSGLLQMEHYIDEVIYFYEWKTK